MWPLWPKSILASFTLVSIIPYIVEDMFCRKGDQSEKFVFLYLSIGALPDRTPAVGKNVARYFQYLSTRLVRLWILM